MGGTLSPQQWLRAGLLAGAVVLTVISIFTPWWTIAVDYGGTHTDSSARPYAADDFKDRTDDDGERQEGLSTEAILTGIFITVAGVGLLAGLVFEGMPLAGKSLPSLFKFVAAGVAVVLGATAIIYTATAWSDGSGGDLGFFDSREVQGFSGFGANVPDTEVSSYAGIGWWLAIVGTIVLPTAAVVHGLVTASPDPMAPTSPPAAPRLSQPVMAPAPPLRTPKLIEARAARLPPDPRKK